MRESISLSLSSTDRRRELRGNFTHEKNNLHFFLKKVNIDLLVSVCLSSCRSSTTTSNYIFCCVCVSPFLTFSKHKAYSLSSPSLSHTFNTNSFSSLNSQHTHTHTHTHTHLRRWWKMYPLRTGLHCLFLILLDGFEPTGIYIYNWLNWDTLSDPRGGWLYLHPPPPPVFVNTIRHLIERLSSPLAALTH